MLAKDTFQIAFFPLLLPDTLSLKYKTPPVCKGTFGTVCNNLQKQAAHVLTAHHYHSNIIHVAYVGLRFRLLHYIPLWCSGSGFEILDL